MKVVVSAKVKLSASNGVAATVAAFQRGLQRCIDEAWERHIRNNVKLHPLVYKELRRELPAQLAVACIKQACGTVKKAKTKPIINRVSVGYNFPRSARLKDGVLRLRLLGGVEEFNISIPSCYDEYFSSWKMREGLLRVDKKGRAFFQFTFAKEVAAKDDDLHKRVLGIDLGVKRLAVLSDGGHIHGAGIRGVKRRYDFLRQKLQRKGTRAAHRLLVKVRGRERRFVRWANHNVSKRIVDACHAATIKMEDLKGVKKRRGRRQNRMLGRWSYFQLQAFISYKAAMRGIVVDYVNPRYTSQLCHKCGRLGSRVKGSFACQHCGLTSFSADLNAARNIAHPMLGERQAAVKLPHDRADEAARPLDAVVEAMVKSPLFQ